MEDLVPIRVKIGLLPNNHAKYPDWSLLPMVDGSGDMRPFAPLGWMYDKQSGHQESRLGGSTVFWDSPHGMQWGCLLVTEAFANAAIALFPGIVEEITEAQFEDFYDTKVMAHVPDVKTDAKAMQDLKVELNLREALKEDTTALKQKIAKALDADDDTEPGRRKNRDKKWADAKSNKGVVIKLKQTSG